MLKIWDILIYYEIQNIRNASNQNKQNNQWENSFELNLMPVLLAGNH